MTELESKQHELLVRLFTLLNHPSVYIRHQMTAHLFYKEMKNLKELLGVSENADTK
jgi:hypothetical protein